MTITQTSSCPPIRSFGALLSNLVIAAALITCARATATAQPCVTPVDDLLLTSNTTVTLCPGTYTLTDALGDGLLRVDNAHDVTIDGAGVQLIGPGRSGYAILIRNSSRVTLRNFAGISGYFYAVRVEESDSVVIDSCTAVGNARDDAGFIDVWSDVSQAHGGAVLFDRSRYGTVSRCVFTGSNDGVALYHCAGMTIARNNLSRNTAFAVRMFYADSCVVLENDGSHTYRENPVNSDAGAILMIVSNENRIEGNDFTYSSDGVFLGQYGHHLTPNNNLFVGNDCSYSPHNAFEATFASGNIFRRNKANFSGYGFWLGYSFNTVVDSNEIIGNREQLSVGTAGIAFDRGYNNSIRHNRIDANAVGILLWKGDPIPGYESQPSERYTITDNSFGDNVRAVDVSGTDELDIRGNEFLRNYEAVALGAGNASVTMNGNAFGSTVMLWIANTGESSIDATRNTFPVADTALIRAKIYDADDDPQVGPVVFVPFDVAGEGEVETAIPQELTDPDSGVWSVFASDGAPSAAGWDQGMKMSGAASLKVVTESGWDVNVHRWPASGLTTAWDLASKTTLSFSVYALNANEGSFQEFSVRLGNESGGYLQYSTSSDMLSGAIGQWRRIDVPLAGSTLWQKSAAGHVVLDSIAYVEVHADTWGGGFTLWIDGMSFAPVTSVPEATPALPASPTLRQNFPNPFNPSTTITFILPGTADVKVSVHDMLGRDVSVLVEGKRGAGVHEATFDGSGLSSGVYICRLRVRPSDTKGDVVLANRMLLVR